ERRLVWVQVMPLSDGGISSKAATSDLSPLSSAREEPPSRAAPQAPINVTKRRREKVALGKAWVMSIGASVRLLRIFGFRFPLECHLAVRIRLAAGSSISGGELIMSCRIAGLHLGVLFERHDRISKPAARIQRHTQRQIGFNETFVEFRSL